MTPKSNLWAALQFGPKKRTSKAESAGHVVPVRRAPVRRRVARGMIEGYKFEVRS